MMGRRSGDQPSFIYQFRLDERIPKDHLLRRIDGFVTAALADMHERLAPSYSEIGRPSVDPELMIRMPVVGILMDFALNGSGVGSCRGWPWRVRIRPAAELPP